MAKVGLKFGEKIQINDKAYRTLNDGLDVKDILGTLKFIDIEGLEAVYESVRQDDGTFRDMPTGELRGVSVGVLSNAQQETIYITIVDMSLEEIENLSLKYREEVELENIVVTYSGIGRDDIYKVFASKIKKKGANSNTVPAKEENKQDKGNK